MYIFYDFETSDKDFLGQILSYYFVLVDETFTPINELEGFIKPNRMECPRASAININQLSLNQCIDYGESEFDAASTIYNFIQTLTNEYGHLPLVGFNSARFDFKHFEKLLLKYGLSPTFYGKLSSLDIYQYSKYCALNNIKDFPFTQKKQHDTYSLSFKLEDLANALNCLDTPQTHDAKDDVLLTIEVTKQLESRFDYRLSEFNKMQHNTSPFLNENQLLKEPFFPFEQAASTPIVNYNEWLVIGKASKSTFILLDLNAYNTQPRDQFEDYSRFTRYLNTRSNALFASQHSCNSIETIKEDPFIQKITTNALQYFKLFPVDWDIEYRPWAMGFNYIQKLREFIERLVNTPDDYSDIISEWKTLRNNTPNQKNELNFMITLFNRFYLNYHPNPKSEHIEKYIRKRYQTGEVYRNKADFISPKTDLETTQFLLTTIEKGSRQESVLMEHHEYCKRFIANYKQYI